MKLITKEVEKATQKLLEWLKQDGDISTYIEADMRDYWSKEMLKTVENEMIKQIDQDLPEIGFTKETVREFLEGLAAGYNEKEIERVKKLSDPKNAGSLRHTLDDTTNTITFTMEDPEPKKKITKKKAKVKK